jgi:hypothetical protein
MMGQTDREEGMGNREEGNCYCGKGKGKANGESFFHSRFPFPFPFPAVVVALFPVSRFPLP